MADGTGSVILYHIAPASFTPVVGENITFSATDAAYQGSPELVNTGFSLTSTNSTGNSVSPTVLTIPQLISSGNQSFGLAPNAEALVELENVYLPSGTTSLTTNTTYTVTDGLGNSTKLYGYGSYSNVAAAVATANAGETASGGTLYSGPVDIIGYSDEYYGVPEIYPLSIIAAPEPASLGLLCVGSVALLARRRRV